MQTPLAEKVKGESEVALPPAYSPGPRMKQSNSSFSRRSLVKSGLLAALAFTALHVGVAEGGQAPIFAPLDNVVTSPDAEFVLPMSVSDSDTALDELDYSARTMHTSLVRSIVFAIDGTNVQARLRFFERAVGTDQVKITVSDGETSVSQSFNLTVLERERLVFLQKPSDQTSREDEPLWLLLDIDSDGIPMEDLTFFGAGADSNLVKSVEFSPFGTKVLTKVTPVPNASGGTRISLSASDGQMVARTSFNLTIIPVPDFPVLKVISVEGQSYLRVESSDRGETYVLERTADFKVWERGPTVTLDGSSADVLLTESRPFSFWQARSD